MSFPLYKSLFVELLRYDVFTEFLISALDVPDVCHEPVEKLYGKQRQTVLVWLQNNRERACDLLNSFLNINPCFYGVLFAIQTMAGELSLGFSEREDRSAARAGFVSGKVKFIFDCLRHAKLPGYSHELLRKRISLFLEDSHKSFSFDTKLLNKVTEDQKETVNNLYLYAKGIIDKFMGAEAVLFLKKLNNLMQEEDSLHNFFDRVVVINLDRRKDRWDTLQRRLKEVNWPFKTPERFAAYDGEKLPTPVGWTYGSGTWGCLLSHREVLARALSDGLDNVLVLEDDIFFCADFKTRVLEFIKVVPYDWDQIMLGGQYFDISKAYDISPDVKKVSLCHRAHAYAVRGRFLKYLYSKLCSSYGHVDHIMNTFQDRYNVYTPKHFLIGQDGSTSDISGLEASPDLMRNPPEKDTPIFLLAPDIELHKEVVSAGFPLHYGAITEDGTNSELHKIHVSPKNKNLTQQLNNILISNIWYARSVYPSKYFTILNPEGILIDELKEAAKGINLVYVESIDQIKETIAKHPFEEELPTQFPDQ